MAERRRRAVIPHIERILTVVPPAEHDRPNLEELFTLLDLAELGTSPLELVQLSWRTVRPQVMGMIAEAFIWHEVYLEAEIVYDQRPFRLGLDDRRVRLVLERWTRFVAPGDTIISFNWDLLHETALYRVNKWHYADGYGFVSADAPTGVQSPIKILKLHGSVNWAQQNEQDREPAIEQKGYFFPGAIDGPGIYQKAAGQWNEGRFLIIPTYLKDMASNTLLLSLWNQAADALIDATDWIVIGFQLHPADALARHLFGSALLRRMTTPRVTLVAPSGGGSNWQSFCANLSVTPARVRSSFEDWITAPRSGEAESS
ncbi:MAG: hypothetical protein HY725_06415 [Candidatus Rokubacteria bacterium]|nr:hypothetical protein [Candidatus Rokubacteria bacterium]